MKGRGQDVSMSWMGERVLIVDDHDGFRVWARVLLEGAGYAVIGEAGDGMTAIQAARILSPEIVLLDVQLPDIDGFEVARRLCQRPGFPTIVLTSTRDACDYAVRLEKSCALGFLSKEDLSVEALTRLLDGRDSGKDGSRVGD
jgi:DNA-binding NarL/FixJ family response regulator